jgi:DnaB-like helicase C terminal domain.
MIRSTYFKTPYSKIVSKWVQEFFTQFSEAPNKHIKDIYLNNKLSLQENEEETNDAISLFLKSISKEYENTETTNIDFEIKTCVNYLKLQSLELLKEQIEDTIASNSPEKGEQLISNYKRVEKPTGQGIDLLNDHNKILEALTKEHNEIITFPGAVGNIISPICRGDFMSFFGPAKRGKSFWLWYSAEIAMGQGNKVIYIPLEMNDTAIIKRCWPSITGQPLYKRTIHSAHFEANEDSKYSIEQDEKELDGVNLESIEDMQKKLRRLYRKGRIKIIPMVACTVNMIESLCDNLYYYENFIPDTIIIDYADYMEPGKKYTDNRDRINTIWKGLRDFANERNVAVITASHTEKKTFDSDIKTSQASEDIRKINHVTLAVALNATDKENTDNIIRLGMMEVREGRHITDQAVCLQCLDLGRPCIDSKMAKDVSGYDKKIEEKHTYKRKLNE